MEALDKLSKLTNRRLVLVMSSRLLSRVSQRLLTDPEYTRLSSETLLTLLKSFIALLEVNMNLVCFSGAYSLPAMVFEGLIQFYILENQFRNVVSESLSLTDSLRDFVTAAASYITYTWSVLLLPLLEKKAGREDFAKTIANMYWSLLSLQVGKEAGIEPGLARRTGDGYVSIRYKPDEYRWFASQHGLGVDNLICECMSTLDVPPQFLSWMDFSLGIDVLRERINLVAREVREVEKTGSITLDPVNPRGFKIELKLDSRAGRRLRDRVLSLLNVLKEAENIRDALAISWERLGKVDKRTYLALRTSQLLGSPMNEHVCIGPVLFYKLFVREYSTYPTYHHSA